MPKQESDYFCKLIPLNDKAINISKFIDGDFKEVYVVESTDCNCRGAIYHKTQCKHMRIKQAWDKLGRPSGFFNVDKAGIPHFYPVNNSEVSNET